MEEQAGAGLSSLFWSAEPFPLHPVRRWGGGRNFPISSQLSHPQPGNPGRTQHLVFLSSDPGVFLTLFVAPARGCAAVKGASRITEMHLLILLTQLTSLDFYSTCFSFFAFIFFSCFTYFEILIYYCYRVCVYINIYIYYTRYI